MKEMENNQCFHNVFYPQVAEKILKTRFLSLLIFHDAT